MKTIVKLLAISAISLMMVGCAEKVDVIEKDGFIILDIEQKENKETIVAQIVEFEMHNAGVVAVNIYDTGDIVIIDAKDVSGFETGDIVLITFEDGFVERVEINRMEVGEHVKAQRVSKELINGRILD